MAPTGAAQADASAQASLGAAGAASADLDSASPSEKPPRLVLPSLQGPVGLFRVSSAEVGPVGQFRLGLRGEYSNSSSFIIMGDRNTRLGGGLAFGIAPVRILEVFGVVNAASNKNQRVCTDVGGTSRCVSEPDRVDPELIRSFGDLTIGAKVAAPLSGVLSAGGEVGLRFLSATNGQLFKGDATSVWFNGLGSADLRKGPNVPLRFHVNLGYLVDNSGNLQDYSKVSRVSKAVSMYAYGIGRSRIRTALGVDAPFDNIGPGVSLQPFAEYHFDLVTGDPDPAFDDFTAPRCRQRTPNTCNDNADQHWATVGLRAQVPGGLAVDLGVDVGLRSVGFPYGTAVAPFNLVMGMAYPFDFGPPPAPRIVTKTVTVEKVLEREPPPRDGYVAGKITNAKGGAPIAGAIVGVVGQRSARVASDADGTFMTKGLPAGEVQLEVSAANFEPQFVKANVVVGHSVEIGAALNPKDQKSKLMGRVTDEAGQGLVGATVKISGTADAQAQTDGSGSFALDLPPGSYAARIETAKFAPKSETFDLAAGVDRTLDISFKGATPVPAGKGVKTPKLASAGAPSGAGGAQVRGKRVFASRPVAFRVNGTTPTAALLGGSQAALDEVVELMTSKPQLKLRIEAHWDPSAGPSVDEVTKKQADTIAAYLTKKGIAADRIEALGVGAKKPVVPNIGLAARAKNRRVELHVAN